MCDVIIVQCFNIYSGQGFYSVTICYCLLLIVVDIFFVSLLPWISLISNQLIFTERNQIVEYFFNIMPPPLIVFFVHFTMFFKSLFYVMKWFQWSIWKKWTANFIYSETIVLDDIYFDSVCFICLIVLISGIVFVVH